MQSETLVEEFSRLVREYKQDDGPGGIEAWNLIADFAVDNAEAIEAALSAAEPVDASSVSAKAWTQKDMEREYLAFKQWFKEQGYPKFPQEYPLIAENAMHAAWQMSAERSALSAQVQDAASGEGRQFSTITDEMVMAGCIAAYGKDFQEWPENSIHDGKVMVSKVLRAAVAAAPAKQEGGHD